MGNLENEKIDDDSDKLEDTTADLEDQIAEEESVEKNASFDFQKITWYRTDRSIQDAISWFERDKIIIPEFQRSHNAWSSEQRNGFIDSIMNELPVPDFFLFSLRDKQTGGEKFFLIDGLQRFSTIIKFRYGKKFSKGLEKSKLDESNKENFSVMLALGGETEKQKYSYAKLPSEVEKNRFLDYSLKFTIIKCDTGMSEEKRKTVLSNIFRRINTGSVCLSKQEIRNVIYAGDLLKKIIEKCKPGKSLIWELSQNHKKMWEEKKRTEQELYLRIATYLHIFREFKNNQNAEFTNSIQQSLDKFCAKAGTDTKLIDLIPEIETALEKILESFPKAFYALDNETGEEKNKIFPPFVEAICIAVCEDKKIDIKKIAELKKDIWKSRENINNKFIGDREENNNEYSCFFTNTTAKNNVLKRVQTILDYGKKQ